MSSAIHCDLVPSRNQSGGKMFGESLESAVAGWYSTRSEYGYAHKTDKRPHDRSLIRSSTRGSLCLLLSRKPRESDEQFRANQKGAPALNL